MLDGVYDVDQCMKCFSDTVYDISFACYGKTYNNRPRQKKRKSLWFNDDCKYAKKSYFVTGRDVMQTLIRKKIKYICLLVKQNNTLQ